MPLTDLVDALEAQAEAQLQEQRQQHAARADELRAAARAEAERVLDAAVAAAEARARAAAVVELGLARSRAAAALRTAREAALRAVRDEAVARLAEVRDTSEYSAVLRELAVEALAVVPRPTAVHVDARDTGLAGPLLAELGVTAPVLADLDTAGGLVLAAPGRRVDNTVETRLEGAWPRLRSAIASSWEAGPDGRGRGEDP